MDGIKSQYPFDIGLFQRQYDTVLAEIESPKQLSIGRVSHSYANKFVEQHRTHNDPVKFNGVEI